MHMAESKKLVYYMSSYRTHFHHYIAVEYTVHEVPYGIPRTDRSLQSDYSMRNVISKWSRVLWLHLALINPLVPEAPPLPIYSGSPRPVRVHCRHLTKTVSTSFRFDSLINVMERDSPNLHTSYLKDLFWFLTEQIRHNFCVFQKIIWLIAWVQNECEWSLLSKKM